MQFSVRSLLILMAVAAVFTMPLYRYSVDVFKRWNAKSTVVQVPDGGVVIMGAVTYRSDGSRWVGGKMVFPPNR